MLYFLCRRRYAEAELAQIWLDEVIETFGLSLKVVERAHETLLEVGLSD